MEIYLNKINALCKNCWCRALCSLCITAMVDKKGLNPDLIERRCESHKKAILGVLQMYLEIFEQNPAVLDKLEHIPS